MDLETMKSPLSGIRVIDLTTYLAGPKAAKLLADWGADVIRIDTTGAIAGEDFGRMYGVPASAQEDPLNANICANKRNIRINLKSPEGQEVMHRLLEKTDVVITSFREKALKKMGLDYETLSEKYPRLIFGCVTGYGDKGADAGKPGFDSTAYWARGGLMASIGEPDAAPPVPIAGFGDNPTGAFLAMGVLVALLGRERTGKGQKVVASLYNTAIYNMSLELACANYHPMPKKSIKHPVSPLINVYECKDGKWISLTSLNYDKDWGKICQTFGAPELVDDPRCNSAKAIVKNCAEMTELFVDVIRKKDRSEWIKLWTEADISFELVQTMEDVLADEQARINGFLQPCTFPNGNTAYMTGAPVQLSDYQVNAFRNVDLSGSHTMDVMAELGFGEDEIQCMLEKQIIQGPN